jgi:hypothetical protein
MAGDPARIIELTRRIQAAAQEAVRYQLECKRLIAQLRKEEESPAAHGRVPRGRYRARADHANALPARIIALLAKAKKPQRPAGLFSALGLSRKQKTTLFTTLHRLTTEGRIARDSRGYRSI